MELRQQLMRNLSDAETTAWNKLVSAAAAGILGPDVTAMAEWVSNLTPLHEQVENAECVIASEGELMRGVFAHVVEKVGPRWFPRRRIRPLTELYGNRPGIVADDAEAFIGGMLEHFARNAIAWDEMQLTVTKGSRDQAGLLRAAAAAGVGVRVIAELESPYIEFGTSWDDYMASLPKKFRWLLRTSRSKLEDAGEVAYRETVEPAGIDQFIDEIEEIERASWKEDAGTSITTNQYQQEFYKRFLPIAAQRGWLSGHSLLFKGEPIAYILGLEFAGVCLDLKESYKVDFRTRSPGHVLKTFAFPKLIERGIQVYDFSGLCEPYKFKWTDKTYHRYRYALHNNTLAGRAWAALARRHKVQVVGRLDA